MDYALFFLAVVPVMMAFTSLLGRREVPKRSNPVQGWSVGGQQVLTALDEPLGRVLLVVARNDESDLG
uniref:DUF2726 domain-containing protein n=1 Tax=Panagrellus redivivus TaxID=6233 RepID=A0A7E4W246_PANRE